MAAAMVVFSVTLAPAATAVPALQIYIDGAVYNAVTETWVTTASTFDIWVVGDVGGHGSILDVKLAAATLTGEAGSISISPTTASGLPNPGDSSTPGAPADHGLSADGAIPVLGDGSNLASHGIYGAGVQFREWGLGDFALTDSPVGDYINTFPTSVYSPTARLLTAYPSTGQVNAYTMTVTGYTAVHFDTYNTIEGKTHSSFGPFSHDGGTTPIPEPGVYLLLGLGLGLTGIGRARSRRKNV